MSDLLTAILHGGPGVLEKAIEARIERAKQNAIRQARILTLKAVEEALARTMEHVNQEIQTLLEDGDKQ